MPADSRVHKEWLNKQVEHVDKNPKELIPVLQEFKTFIETNPRIRMLFTQMWEEVPMKRPYNKDPTGHKAIRDYGHMLAVLNHVFSRAPEWTDAAESVGMVGVPMCAIFDYVMATPSGHAAFLDTEVNKMLKKVLNEWGKFLKVGRLWYFSRLRPLLADLVFRPPSPLECSATTVSAGSESTAERTSCRSPTRL